MSDEHFDRVRAEYARTHITMNDAYLTMADTYGTAGWPSDWYGHLFEKGWAFITPSRPERFNVVTHSGLDGKTEGDETPDQALDRLMRD